MPLLIPYLALRFHDLICVMLTPARCIQIRMRGKAARALIRYTKTAMQDLQHDEDEMLRGQQPSQKTTLKTGELAFFQLNKSYKK